MPPTRWLVFNRRLWLLLAAAAAALFLLVQGVGLWLQSRIDPGELLRTALDNTLSARSFRFSVQTEVGREDSASTVSGKRVAPDRVHIKGNLQDTEFELVRIGEKTYFKESLTDRWFTLTGNNMVDSQLFVELNPLQHFNFKDVPEIEYKGIVKERKEKLALLEMRPIVNNPFLQTRYGEFFYRVWIEPDKKYIRKAEVEATGLEGEDDKIKITIELWDYNKQIKISPPEEKENAPQS